MGFDVSFFFLGFGFGSLVRAAGAGLASGGAVRVHETCALALEPAPLTMWVIAAYSLAFAALLLPGGAIGDHYGRRLALITGLAIFGGGLAVAMTTQSPTEPIVLWVVLGLGAALVMPATLATITSTFPASERTRAAAPAGSETHPCRTRAAAPDGRERVEHLPVPAPSVSRPRAGAARRSRADAGRAHRLGRAAGRAASADR